MEFGVKKLTDKLNALFMFCFCTFEISYNSKVCIITLTSLHLLMNNKMTSIDKTQTIILF